MLNDLHQAAQMGQDGTAHEDGDLLDDLDASVASLPGLLALAHGLEEGQQGGDAQGGSHHSKGTGCGVSHILVHVVNVRPHGGDHGGQSSSLGKTTKHPSQTVNALPQLDTSQVIQVVTFKAEMIKNEECSKTKKKMNTHKILTLAKLEMISLPSTLA